MNDTAQLPVPTPHFLQKPLGLKGQISLIQTTRPASRSTKGGAKVISRILTSLDLICILLQTRKSYFMHHINSRPVCRAAVTASVPYPASQETEAALCSHPRSLERSADQFHEVKGREERRCGPWYTRYMETSLPVWVLCAGGGRMGDSEASPSQVRSERGTGVNLAKVSGDEQVHGKGAGAHGEAWAGTCPVLKERPSALAHICRRGNAHPLMFLWIFMRLMLTNYSKF